MSGNWSADRKRKYTPYDPIIALFLDEVASKSTEPLTGLVSVREVLEGKKIKQE